MKVIIPQDKAKLQLQIEALKYLIERDNEKDKKKHERALKDLQAMLEP